MTREKRKEEREENEIWARERKGKKRKVGEEGRRGREKIGEDREGMRGPVLSGRALA